VNELIVDEAIGVNRLVGNSQNSPQNLTENYIYITKILNLP
jgi:hypothetical protein